MSLPLFATAIGGLITSAPLPDPPIYYPPISRVAVYIHSSAWPFHQIAELMTATDVHRAWQLMKSGQAAFQVAKNDPQIGDDILERGNIVAIVSGHIGFPVWVGPIVNIEEDRAKPALNVSAQSMEIILEGRPNHLRSGLKMGSGSAFRQFMLDANRLNHSGIGLYSTNGVGRYVELDSAGQYAADAMTEAAKRSDYEWWLDVVRTSAYIEVTADFNYRRGLDDTGETLVFEEGFNLTEVVRVLDTQGLHQSVTVYGGTGPVSDRPALTRSAKSSPISWVVGRAAEPASDFYNDAVNIPASVRTERVIYKPTISARRDLSLEAQVALELPIGSSERFRITVNELVDWSMLQVGNYARIKLDDDGLGAVNRKVRIVGVQPDEAAGECVLVVETPLK